MKEIYSEIQNWLKSNIYNKSGIYNNRCSNVKWWNKYQNRLEQVFEITDYLPPDSSLKMRIECILQNYTDTPKCQTCGAPVKLHKNKFSKYCSIKCSAKNPNTLELRKKTNFKKYGEPFANQAEIVKDKLRKHGKLDDRLLYYLDNPKWLKRVHITNKLTLIDISIKLKKLTGISIYYGTVKEYLIKHGIDFKHNKNNSSSGETSICDFLDEHNIEYVKHHYVNDTEIDIFIPSINLAIEYNGLYWHSYNSHETIKEINRHITKTKKLAAEGIETFQIFENEWLNPLQNNIWKSMILNRLSKSRKIFARKCLLNEIKDTKILKDFLNENHLQGYTSSKYNYGLVYNGELIAVLTLNTPRFNKNYQFEIIRYCVKTGYNVVGGFSKLLKNFQKIMDNPTIITYSNNRYSLGNLYLKNGFKYIKDTAPNYFYWDKKSFDLQPRYKYQKHKLHKILNNFDEKLSEEQNMFNNGYRRIWDCGNKAFEIK